MTALPIDTDTRLPAGLPFRISESLTQTIEVLNGTLWITRPRQPRDLLVTAGETVVLDLPIDAIVSAIGGPADVRTRTLTALPIDYAVAA